MEKTDDLDERLEALRQGNVRALARTITEIENGSRRAVDLLKALYPHTGRSRIVGVTGSPGSGKSTLTDCLAGAFRRRAHKVGIIAVDPTSPFSGGAILGDRIRMQAHGADPGVFIRSMATRGRLGGLAAATHDVALLLDAAGYETILVETVGVGQDEVDIIRIADVALLVLVPGMGDDVQTIKAGLMEIGDILVLNKADRPGADKVEQELQAMLSLGGREDGWTPPIVRTVALEGFGIDELLKQMDRFLLYRRDHSEIGRRRQVQACSQKLLDLLGERLLQNAMSQQLQNGQLARLAEQVLDRQIDPYTVVEEIVARTIKQ